jgi:NAD(P) transhydrogenase subunit beta
MTSSLATVCYLGATILFVLCLGGLSNPETSRRGNVYGIVGMAIAVLATVFGPHVTPAGFPYILGAMVVGAAVGLYAARIVKMTQMPELVALMHSLVGLAAMLVGYANFVDPAVSVGMTPAEQTIHEIEMYLGVLISCHHLLGSRPARSAAPRGSPASRCCCRGGTGSISPASSSLSITATRSSTRTA